MSSKALLRYYSTPLQNDSIPVIPSPMLQTPPAMVLKKPGGDRHEGIRGGKEGMKGDGFTSQCRGNTIVVAGTIPFRYM